jgi:hypothetical protein
MKIPLPYSRQIIPMGNLLIYFGGHDAWKLAQRANDNGLAAMVLPVGAQPHQYDWSICRGCTLLAMEVSETNDDYRRNLVIYAAAAGALEVYVHSALPEHGNDPVYLGGAA